jgi:division protein CdvB (Snf7/Vps24/ESCRT-III family)
MNIDDVLFADPRVRGWLRHLHEFEKNGTAIPKKVRKLLAKEVLKLRSLADRIERAISQGD